MINKQKNITKRIEALRNAHEEKWKKKNETFTFKYNVVQHEMADDITMQTFAPFNAPSTIQ